MSDRTPEADVPGNVVALRQEPAVGALALSSAQTDWTPAQRAALVQLGLGEAPNADLAVFMHQAQRTGLDPFTRQIYMIGRNGKNPRTQQWETKYTIQTGIDGFRIIADRRPEYGGQVGPEWCGEDGVWRDVWVAATPPAAARVGVIRKGWAQPIYATALFREYAGTDSKGNLTKMWRDKGSLMIAKCAEALALRKAFPQDLSGLYTSDEMNRADHHAEQPAAPVIVDQAPAPGFDWDAEIARLQAAGDADGLGRLWQMAKAQAPQDEALHARIVKAGKATRDTAEKAAEGQVVEAEIVDDADPLIVVEHFDPADPWQVVQKLASDQGWRQSNLLDDFIARMGVDIETATDDQFREYAAKLNSEEQAA